MLGILQHIDVVAAFGPKKATFGGNYPWAGSMLLNIAIHIAIIVIICNMFLKKIDHQTLLLPYPLILKGKHNDNNNKVLKVKKNC